MHHTHVLSVTDIQLIVDLFETQDVVREAAGRERQIDSLIRMGYLRPVRGIFVLTELGEKTARSLQARHFVPSRVPEPAALAQGSAGGAEVAAVAEAAAAAAADGKDAAGQSDTAAALETA